MTLLDGMKTVYFKVKDKSGKVSEVVSDTIILDTIPPELTDLKPSEKQSSKAVTLSVQTSEEAYVRWDYNEMDYDSMDNQFDRGEGERNHSTLFEASEGDNTIYISTRDLHGNTMRTSIPLTFVVELTDGNNHNPDDTTPDDDSKGNNAANEMGSSMIWVWVFIVVFLIISIIIIMLIVLLKKRRGGEGKETSNKIISGNINNQIQQFPQPSYPPSYEQQYDQSWPSQPTDEWYNNNQQGQQPVDEQYHQTENYSLEAQPPAP